MSWSCKVCHRVNRISEPTCDVCGGHKDDDDGAPPPPPPDGTLSPKTKKNKKGSRLRSKSGSSRALLSGLSNPKGVQKKKKKNRKAREEEVPPPPPTSSSPSTKKKSLDHARTSESPGTSSKKRDSPLMKMKTALQHKKESSPSPPEPVVIKMKCHVCQKEAKRLRACKECSKRVCHTHSPNLKTITMLIPGSTILKQSKGYVCNPCWNQPGYPRSSGLSSPERGRSSSKSRKSPVPSGKKPGFLEKAPSKLTGFLVRSKKSSSLLSPKNDYFVSGAGELHIILDSMISGEHQKLFSAIKYEPANMLCDLLPTIIALLSSTPFWFQLWMQECVNALMVRASDSDYIAQTLLWLASSGTMLPTLSLKSIADSKISIPGLDGSQFRGHTRTKSTGPAEEKDHHHISAASQQPLWEPFLRPNDQSLRFFSLFGGKDLGIGFRAMVSSDLSGGDSLPSILLPFPVEGNSQPIVKSATVLKIFTSKAKPLLLRLDCISPDEDPTKSENKSRLKKGKSNPPNRAPPSVPLSQFKWNGSSKELDHNKSKKSSEVVGLQGVSQIENESSDNNQVEATIPYLVIYKSGDDLRQDAACLQVFRLVNRLWQQSLLQYYNHPVHCKVYGVMPLDKSSGLIEFVPDVRSIKVGLKELKERASKDPVFMPTLVASAAGAFMATFLLGIGDRHYENILIGDDGTLFHIDFGYALGNRVATLDTAPLAITQDFKDFLGDEYWNAFLQVCVKAYSVLHQNASLLQHYITLLFGPFFDTKDMMVHLESKALLDLPHVEMQEKLRKMIAAAPRNYKTKLKNFAHKVGQQIKSPAMKSISSSSKSRSEDSPSSPSSPRGKGSSACGSAKI